MTDLPADPAVVVLVVEDEALLRMYVADLLHDAGFDVVEAGNANDALEAMELRGDISVLFTDIQMPGPLDGVELARKVHEQWPNVLLLITSGDRRLSKAEIPDHGHFLAKPYAAQELVKKIDALSKEAAQR